MNPQQSSQNPAIVRTVCIGASAGGLSAARALLSGLDAEISACILFIQHLASDQKSQVDKLLAHETSLVVRWAEEGAALEAGTVLICPPGFTMTLAGDRVQLEPIVSGPEKLRTIDALLESVSRELGDRSACVILSGTGVDGSEGAKSIAKRGGLVLVQDPEEATQSGMPTAAIQQGFVDVVGPVSELAERLMHWSRVSDFESSDENEEGRAGLLGAILDVVLERTGHDFRDYKRSTLWRRILRRQVVQSAERLEDYLQILEDDPQEVEELFDDLLISVTSFFRDTEAFETLDRRFLSSVFEAKKSGESVRVWVAGCATGEEAYSIALLMLRQAAQRDKKLTLQVFATDIDENALDVARAGRFPNHMMEQVPSDLRDHYFVEGDGSWTANAELREIVLFARHNVLKDPPFSRLDLISCRNTLIYFSRAVQKDVLRVFHYALNPDGLLFLGRSESAEGSQLFSTLHSSARLYQRREGVVGLGRLPFAPIVPQWTGGMSRALRRPMSPRKQSSTELSQYEQWVLQQRTPPRIVLDADFKVTHVFAGAARYLKPEGQVSQDVAGLITGDLQHPLSLALRRALKEESEVLTRAVVLDLSGVSRSVSMSVFPVFVEEGLEFVDIAFFEQAVDPEKKESTSQEKEAELRQLIAELEDEVAHLHAELRVSYEEYETSSEELRASNEELQSTNEELQSTAEELETSREELQSMNEELVTVNQELKVKIDELMAVNSDLQNLMHATEVSTIFLDRALCIKRFTPPVVDIFNILEADIGRPIAHLSHQLDFEGINQRASQVLEDLSRFETEVRHRDGRWFSMRMWPYRTIDHRIEGVVLTFVDVSTIKQASLALELDAAQHQLFANLTRESLGEDSLGEILKGLLPDVCRVLGCDRVAVWIEQEGIEPLIWSRNLGLLKSVDESWAEAPAVLDSLDESGTYLLGAQVPWAPDIQQTLLVPLPSGPDGESAGFIWAGRNEGAPFDDQGVNFVSTFASILGQIESRNTANRKRVALLREVESFYDNAPIGLAMLDHQLGVKRVNLSLARMFDIESVQVSKPSSAPDPQARTLPDLVPDLAIDVSEALQTVQETGEPIVDRVVSGPTSARPAADRVWLYSVYPLESPTLEKAGFHLIVRDVTLEHRGRQALEKSERRFRTLASLVTDHAYELELRDGELVPIWSTLGTALPDVVKYPAVFELFDDGFQPGHRKLDEIAGRMARLEEAEHVTTEYAVTASDGQTSWFRDSALVERNEAGTLVRVTGAAEDVTMERTTEQLVAQAEKYESLRVLAGGVAHDFNNLLVAILGQLGILDELTDHPESDEAVDLATDAAERASAIAGDLLAYSGEAVGSREAVSLARMLGEVTRLFSAMIPDQISVELYIGEPNIHAIVNESQLHQMLLNLLRNASQSMDSGTVNVRLSGYQLLPDETDWWDLTGREIEPGEYCLIEIEDNGRGMSAEVQQRMFEPFFTTREDGSGVGMSAALGFIRSQSGGIKVWSAVGHGTTISILLPRLPPEKLEEQDINETMNATDPHGKETDETTTSVSKEDLKKTRIIVVDDEEVVLRTLTKVLSRRGYTVVASSAPHEALELFKEEGGFNLLIADQSMPEMTGVELAITLQKDYPELAIIITSGFARGDIDQALKDTGAVFLSKPFPLSELTRAVNKALAIRA